MALFEDVFDIINHPTNERALVYKNSGGRFSHYTSSDAAFNILKHGTIWLRNLRLMNDYSEIHIGTNIWANTFSKNEFGKRLSSIIDQAHPGLWDVIQTKCNLIKERSVKETYAISVSEFPKPDGSHEARNGKLSMWRAYAQKDGICLVLNSSSFYNDNEDSYLISSPMSYYWPTDHLTQIDLVSDYFDEHRVELKDTHPELIQSIFEHWYLYTILSSKHKAFEEEREWRIIRHPNLSMAIDDSAKNHGLTFEPVALRGIPQTVLKIDLRAISREQIPGAHPSRLISEILVGPSDFPDVIGETIRKVMDSNEIPKEVTVSITGIPLRLNNG